MQMANALNVEDAFQAQMLLMTMQKMKRSKSISVNLKMSKSISVNLKMSKSISVNLKMNRFF